MGKKSKTLDTSASEAAEVEENGAEESGLKWEDMPYEDKLRFSNAIAKPMASRKLAKKIFKVLKKSYKVKYQVRIGMKECQLRIRKGERGFVVFAGDVTPIDIYCHMPSVCEEKKIPYVYVPTKRDLGSGMGVRRGSLMVMVRPHEDYQELYDECEQALKELPTAV